MMMGSIAKTDLSVGRGAASSLYAAKPDGRSATRVWARIPPPGEPLDLAFAEDGYGFIALDRLLRRVECPKPQAGIHAASHKPV
jgi:hypothetical protein